jgi:hypothetical protein
VSTTPDADLLARITALEAREELRDLAARYCEFCDARDYDSFVGLFAVDGVLSTGIRSTVWTEARGRDDIREWLTTGLENITFTNTYPHSQVVEFQNAERATGVVHGHGEHGIDGTCMLASNRYDDVYVRQDGIWRFASRHITFRYNLMWPEMSGGYYESAITGFSSDIVEALPGQAGDSPA